MMDKTKRYNVDGHRGVAFYFTGYAQVWEPYTFQVEHSDECEERQKRGLECWCSGPYEVESSEGEWVNNPDRVLMVMVGDDHKWEVDPEDCTEIDEMAYCHVCGQMGCTADGRDRSESEAG